MTDERPTVPCVACAELILADAKKCRFCGEFQPRAGPKVRPKRTFRPPDSDATAILVLGILGLCVCGILGVIAWVKGNAYLDACKSLGCEPKGTAVAGRILGMIATGLIALAILGALLTLGSAHRR
jgi:hypothetical protein